MNILINCKFLNDCHVNLLSFSNSQAQRHSHVKIDEFDEIFLQIVRYTIAIKWWHSKSRFRRSEIKCLCENLTKLKFSSSFSQCSHDWMMLFSILTLFIWFWISHCEFDESSMQIRCKFSAIRSWLDIVMHFRKFRWIFNFFISNIYRMNDLNRYIVSLYYVHIYFKRRRDVFKVYIFQNLIVAITLTWFHVSNLIKQCFFENYDYRFHLNFKKRRFRLIFRSTKFCNVEKRFLFRSKRFHDRSWKIRMKKKFAKKIIIIDVFWSLISISKWFFLLTQINEKNKFKISKRFFVERRVAKIVKHQNFKIVLKSFSRRSIRFERFKLFSSFLKFENVFDDDSFLNINMINVVVFHKQINKTNQKKNRNVFNDFTAD